MAFYARLFIYLFNWAFSVFLKSISDGRKYINIYKKDISFFCFVLLVFLSHCIQSIKFLMISAWTNGNPPRETVWSYRGHIIGWGIGVPGWAPLARRHPPFLFRPGYSATAGGEMVLLLLLLSNLSPMRGQVVARQFLVDARRTAVGAVLRVRRIWGCAWGGRGRGGGAGTDREADHVGWRLRGG